MKGQFPFGSHLIIVRTRHITCPHCPETRCLHLIYGSCNSGIGLRTMPMFKKESKNFNLQLYLYKFWAELWVIRSSYSISTCEVNLRHNNSLGRCGRNQKTTELLNWLLYAHRNSPSYQQTPASYVQCELMSTSSVHGQDQHSLKGICLLSSKYARYSYSFRPQGS